MVAIQHLTISFILFLCLIELATAGPFAFALCVASCMTACSMGTAFVGAPACAPPCTTLCSATAVPFTP